MIEVVLLERVEGLGHLGSVVRVRPGFARNWLLPQRKALRATKANLAYFEAERAAIEAQNAVLRTQAEHAAVKLANLKLAIIRQASEVGQLYGSITARDIATAAVAAGHTVSRQQVVLDAPIKSLGLYDVRVRLHADVVVSIGVNVARSLDEARAQESAVNQELSVNDDKSTKSKRTKVAKDNSDDSVGISEGVDSV